MAKLSESEKEAKKQSFIRSQIHFICKHALGILIFTALATAAVLPLVAHLKLRTNFMDLLPEKYPSITRLKELMSHVGGTSFVIIIAESPDAETAKLAAQKFSKRAASFQQVDYVDNRTNAPVLERSKLLFLKLDSLEKLKLKIKEIVDYNRRKSNPFFLDLVEEEAPTLNLKSFELEEKVSKIGGFSAKENNSYMQVLLLKPKHPISDFAKSRQLFAEANAAFAEIEKEFQKPVKFGITGSYRTRFQEYQTVNHDLRLTGILATIFLVIINLVAFKNGRSLIYAYLPLAIGVIWTWAFTKVSIGYLNLITSFLAAILFGMGGDYTFHILTSFEADYRQTGNVEKALEMTYLELWDPMWSSMWTTAVVFYAMMISQFEGFRHFGIIAGVGIVISFVIVLYLQPCLIVLIEKYFPLKRKATAPRKHDSKRTIIAIVAAGLLFTLFSIFQTQKLRFNYDFRDLQAKNEDAIVLAERLGGYFGVHLNPVVFITPNRERATELAQQINAYIAAHPKTMFDFAASLTSHVPKKQEEKIKVMGEIDETLIRYQTVIDKLDADTQERVRDLKNHLHPKPFGLDELPSGLFGQYEGKDRQVSTVFLYPNARILDGEFAKKFVKEARQFPLPEDVRLAGEPVIYADILNLIGKDSPIALGLSTIVVFLLVFWHFKRLDHVLWVHVPFVLGLLWMFGMMVTAGVKFNFFNMVIVPSILGVGIDNGIYIFDRYKQKREEDFFQSMDKSIKGVVLSSATNIAAFGSLLFASHNGMASMGQVGFFGFLSCLLTSVFFVPALIEFYELKYSHLFRRQEKP